MKTKTLGKRLEILMDEYGLSPEKLAGLVGMTGVSIRAITKDESKPYQSSIDKISAALGSTSEWLQHGRGEMLPNGRLDLNKSKEANGWKDEAWQLAKAQLEKKDEQLDEKDNILKMLAVSFDRVTKMMQDSGMSFLHPVAKTGTDY